MSILFAMLFAQSLWGDLAAPYAEANKEANAAVLAKVEEAQAEAARIEEDKVEDATVEDAQAEEAVAEAVEEAGEEAAGAAPDGSAPEADGSGEASEASPAEAPEPEPVPAPEETPPPAPAPEPNVESEPAPAPESKAEAEPKAEPEAEGPIPRSVKITSARTDYDRREGVVMFDGDVFVHDDEYQMHSDQLYVFLDGTNELKRIVAIGNVTITNETRVGSCAKAAYTRSAGKVVMYGDGGGAKARLADNGKRRSEVEGRKITFWIDSEQVEVEGSTVTLDAGGFGGKDGAKKLLGK